MYQVLVVDDESRHRRGLIKAIRAIRPDYFIDEAINGEEALKRMNDRLSDLVITDIRMPVMDGLQFMENLQALSKGWSEIIIVTAYRDFNYAQRAIQLHALEYVLKPVELERLQEVVERAEQKLAEKRQQARVREELLNKLQETRYIYVNHQLGQYLSGQLNAEEWHSLCGMYDLAGAGTIVSLRFDEGSRHALQNRMDSLLEELTQAVDHFGVVYACPLHGQTAEAAIVVRFHTDDGSAYEPFESALREAIAQVSRRTRVRIAPGFSELVPDLAASCLEAFRRSRGGLLDSDSPVANKMERAITACMAYIQDHYMEELSLEQMADRFGFNAFYFSHVFKQTTGMAFTSCLNDERMRRAKVLLESTDDKVYQIAAAVGYRDAKYFNRQFKRNFGVTPEQYRNAFRG